ncbi:hypothetical protein HBI29_162640 [Parastagonospora nodorum]|nr:hypothetical protein HBI29_162640 [Parastagonospora nodorum]
MTDSPRARTPINPSAVLYEQSAAQPSLPAKVSNIDLDFVPSVAFIPNVHIANSLRARTLINLSAVLYEQAAAQTSLPAEVGNIDLDFVPSVAFIPNVYIADSLRARTLINLSAVLYEQAAARTGLPAKVGNISLPAEVSIIDLNFVPGVAFDAIGNVELTGNLLGNADRVNNNNNNVAPTPQFSLTALLNPRSLASKRPALSSSDLNRGRTDPTIASQISLIKQLHNVQERTASPAKRIKTDEDRKKSTHRQGFNGGSSLKLQKTSSQVLSQTGLLIDLIISDNDDVQLVRDNIEKLICVSKVKHTYVQAHTVPYPNLKKYLSNSTENSLLRPVFKLQRYNYYNPQDTDVADVFNTVVSKSDKVPTREPSSHIKTELYPHQKQALYFMWDKEQDYSAEEHDYRKFYRLVITGEDTHYKQIIKKAYIMSLERASLILFMT